MFFIVHINCSQFNKQIDVDVKLKTLFMRKTSTNANIIIEKTVSNSLHDEKIAARFVFSIFHNELFFFSNFDENSMSSQNKIARAHVAKKIYSNDNVFDDMQYEKTFQMKSLLKKFTSFSKKIRKIVSNNNKTRASSINTIYSNDNNNFSSSSQIQIQVIQQRNVVDSFQFTFIIEKRIVQLLNIVFRRYYLIFLNSKNVDDSMRIVFFNVRFNHDAYKMLWAKCFQSYK